jgi:hypothetical protein
MKEKEEGPQHWSAAATTVLEDEGIRNVLPAGRLPTTPPCSHLPVTISAPYHTFSYFILNSGK